MKFKEISHEKNLVLLIYKVLTADV